VRMFVRVPVSDCPERRRVIQRPTPFLLDDFYSMTPSAAALGRNAHRSGVPLPVLQTAQL
jgi:hypothetical protein